MLNRSFLLGCVCALALGASPALAGNFSGTLSGDYLHFDFHDLGLNANAWGAAGEFQGEVADGMHVQGDINYHHISGNGVGIDDSILNGAVYWDFDAGRAGGNLGYQTIKIDHAIGHLVTYGGFGEFWAGDMFTFGVKGGGYSDTNGGGSGYYLGAEAKAYVMPDLALAGTIGHTGNNGETDYAASAEWLVSEDVPISISGTYTYTHLCCSEGNANVWAVKLAYYFNGGSAQTLEDRQRGGNLGWASGAGTFGFQF